MSASVYKPRFCDDQRCRMLAKWEFPAVKIRHEGESWRDYRLCDGHAATVTLPRRAIR